MKRTIQQAKTTTITSTPPPKRSRPSNHTTHPPTQIAKTEIFRAGRRRQPPRRTHNLSPTNTTHNKREANPPTKHPTHKQTILHKQIQPKSQPSSPTKTTIQQTNPATKSTQLITNTPPPPKRPKLRPDSPCPRQDYQKDQYRQIVTLNSPRAIQIETHSCATTHTHR